MNTKIKTLFYCLFLLSLVILSSKMPIKEVLENLGLDKDISILVRRILLNTLFCVLAIFEIKRKNILNTSGLRISILNRPVLYLFLIPHILLFTVGFEGTRQIPLEEFTNYFGILYLIFTFSIGIFEEILFRGLIQNVLINVFKTEKNGEFLGLFITSILFGSMHFINLHTDLSNLSNTIIQVFAATCIGSLYGALLLRTRNIYPILFFHGLIDFSSLSQEYFPRYFEQKEQFEQIEQSFGQQVASIFVIFILFGSASVLALAVLKSKE